MCFGTSTVSQLIEFSISHIITVRIFKRHHRPHTCNVMIKKSTFLKIYWIVKIKTNKFGINVEIYIFVDLGIDFCCLSDRRIVFMTWDWQEWVVALLIVLCVARMVYGIYKAKEEINAEKSVIAPMPKKMSGGYQPEVTPWYRMLSTEPSS